MPSPSKNNFQASEALQDLFRALHGPEDFAARVLKPGALLMGLLPAALLGCKGDSPHIDLGDKAQAAPIVETFQRLEDSLILAKWRGELQDLQFAPHAKALPPELEQACKLLDTGLEAKILDPDARRSLYTELSPLLSETAEPYSDQALLDLICSDLPEACAPYGVAVFPHTVKVGSELTLNISAFRIDYSSWQNHSGAPEGNPPYASIQLGRQLFGAPHNEDHPLRTVYGAIFSFGETPNPEEDQAYIQLAAEDQHQPDPTLNPDLQEVFRLRHAVAKQLVDRPISQDEISDLMRRHEEQHILDRNNLIPDVFLGSGLNVADQEAEWRIVFEQRALMAELQSDNYAQVAHALFCLSEYALDPSNPVFCNAARKTLGGLHAALPAGAALPDLAILCHTPEWRSMLEVAKQQIDFYVDHSSRLASPPISL